MPPRLNEVMVDELLNTAPCGFLSFTDDSRITTVNATLLDMLGYARHEVVGGPVERILTPGTKIFYQTHFFPLIRLHGRADEIFLMLCDARGQRVGVLANAVRRERDGTVVNDCIFIRVVEREKYEQQLLLARRAADEARRQMEVQRDALAAANDQLEQQALELEVSAEELQELNAQLVDRTGELERLRAAADQANQAKSDFLAMMSHELRTPLNAIGGYAQILEMGVQGPVNERQRDSLARIDQSQRHLLRLINEILDLARVESGHVSYDISDFGVDELLRDVMPLVEPQLSQKGLQLHAAIAEEHLVRGDREKLIQIVLNLLSNAIKFTAAGGEVEVSTEHDSGTHVAIKVRDTGVGIPADMVESIFEPFVQVETGRTKRVQGTGLGLAISRELARGMNGDLTASSKEGVGSTFILTVPAGNQNPL